jgi:hypothetical protein
MKASFCFSWFDYCSFFALSWEYLCISKYGYLFILDSGIWSPWNGVHVVKVFVWTLLMKYAKSSVCMCLPCFHLFLCVKSLWYHDLSSMYHDGTYLRKCGFANEKGVIPHLVKASTSHQRSTMQQGILPLIVFWWWWHKHYGTNVIYKFILRYKSHVMILV